MNFDLSNPVVVGVICAVVLILVLAMVWAVIHRRNRRRTEQLRSRFGPEYELALREHGSRAAAEAALMERVNHVSRLNIRPLSEEERDRYMAEWDSVQARFVDHPRGAVTEADELIHAILKARGYEGGNFDRRVADLSVNHAHLVEPYRRANAVSLQTVKDEASTEDLRNAMILYRNVIEELLQSNAPVSHRQAA